MCEVTTAGNATHTYSHTHTLSLWHRLFCCTAVVLQQCAVAQQVHSCLDFKHFFFQRKCHYHVIAGVTGSGHLIWVSQRVTRIFKGRLADGWYVMQYHGVLFFACDKIQQFNNNNKWETTLLTQKCTLSLFVAVNALCTPHIISIKISGKVK